MTDEAGAQRRDASAWPRGATPVSLIIGLLSLLVGLSMANAANAPLPPLLALVLGVVIGGTLIVVGIRRWLAGEPIPLVLGVISGVTSIAAIVLIKATDSATGPALLCGLIAGLMFSNIWAVRAADKHGKTPSP